MMMRRPSARGLLLLLLQQPQRCCASHRHPAAARCEGGGGGSLSAVFDGGGGSSSSSVRSTHTHSSRAWSVGAEVDGGGDAASLGRRTDRDAAQRIRDKYKRSALAQQTPQVVTGDRGKLRAFVRMLREVEEMREQGWTVGPLTYAVAISVCNAVLTVTHRPDDECEADGSGGSGGGGSAGKSSVLLAAERLYNDFQREWGGRRQGARRAKERVYSAIMHSYIRGGRGADCVRVLREDMPAAGVSPTASHYGLAVSALGRLGEPDAAFRLVAAVQADGRVDVATVGVLRSLVGACATHAAAKRAVLQFARLGVGVDAHVARAYVQVNLREAGLRSSWGLDETRCVAAALAPAARATLARNVRSCREYVERVGVRRTALLTACYMHAHAVGGRYKEALDEVGLGVAAEGGDAAAVRRLQETVCGGGGAFYVYSTLMFVCAQACFADDRSRDWVRLAERVFRKAEVARVGGLSAVFHTRLMTVYAAARDGERASLLLLHMRQAEARVRPSPGILRCWRIATSREEAD